MNLESLTDKKRIAKFLGAGAIGFAVENLLLYLLVEYTGLNLYIAKAVGLESAIITVFLINDSVAFSDLDKKAYAVLRTNAVRSAGTAVSFIGLFLGTSAGLNYLVANALAVIAATGFNYVSDFAFTWKGLES